MSIALGVLVGLALGLTGGGGSIFAVPLLVFGLGVAPLQAVTVSLAAVSATAAFGALGAMRAGLVELRAALIFAVGGVMAAPLGVHAAGAVPERAVLGGFAVLMCLVAMLMWVRAGAAPESTAVTRSDFVPGVGEDRGPVCRIADDRRLRLTAPCGVALTVVGAATGLLSGFFGVGGGFVIVPALSFVTQLGIHRAVATSLFVITLIGASGVASAWFVGREIPAVLTGFFLVGGLIGMTAGRSVASRVAGPTLQKVFAVAMLATGCFTLFVGH